MFVVCVLCVHDLCCPVLGVDMMQWHQVTYPCTHCHQPYVIILWLGYCQTYVIYLHHVVSVGIQAQLSCGQSVHRGRPTQSVLLSYTVYLLLY